MIRVRYKPQIQGWEITPLDNDDCNFHQVPYEPPSKQTARVILGDLKDELPPLLYGRYCMLRTTPHGVLVKGLGRLYKFSDGEDAFICEEK